MSKTGKYVLLLYKADDFQRRVEDLVIKYGTTSLMIFSTWKKFDDVYKLFFFDKMLPLPKVIFACIEFLLL